MDMCFPILEIWVHRSACSLLQDNYCNYWVIYPKGRPILSQNKTASTLSFLEAIKIVFGRHEWMDNWSLCRCTIRPPLLVFLLALWHNCFTQRVSSNVKSRHLVNPMQIHATLHEHIFTPWFIL